jgi:uncharacterized repeat protein (TIGR03837 family)
LNSDIVRGLNNCFFIQFIGNLVPDRVPVGQSAHADRPPPALLWDLFCQVIDNHGDLGVCWRLAAQLAARGQRVRLWVDDARALAWMAPGAVEGHGWPGIQVLPWTRPFHAGMPPEAMAQLPRADVWIEAFGCEIAPEFIAFNAIRRWEMARIGQ